MTKNLTKRLSALTLALFMVLALLPANTVRADENGEWTLTAKDVSEALENMEEEQTSLELDCFTLSSKATVEDDKIFVDEVKITAEYGFTAEIEWAAKDETGKISLGGSCNAEKDGQKTTSKFTVSDGGTYELTLSENAWLYKIKVTEKKPEEPAAEFVEEPIAEAVEEPIAEAAPEAVVQPLAAPSSIQATFNSENGAIKVTWTKVEGADSYRVSWKTEEQSDRMGYSNFIFDDTADEEGKLSYWIEEELAVGKTYEIFVAAEREDDSKENEKPVTVTVLAQSQQEPDMAQVNENSEESNQNPEQAGDEVLADNPEAVVDAPEAAWNGVPENLAAVSGCQGIVLTWDAVEDATGYNIYQDDDLIPVDVTELQYTVADLTADTEYTFTVKAVKDGVEAADGADVTVAYTGAHDFGADWNTDDEGHWNLCKDCAEKGNIGNHVDENNDGSCDECGYTVAVAWNGIPENLSATSDCQGIVLTWDAVTDATGYNIYLDGIRIATDVTDTECRAMSLSADSTYTFVVYAVKDGTEAVDGATVTATYTLTHDFTGEWESDDSDHWKVCGSCGEKGDMNAHVDDNGDGSCDVCGYSMKPAPSTEASSEPTQPSSEPTQPSSEPTQPSSEPTQPSTEATEPSSEPTQPSSEPTQPTNRPDAPVISSISCDCNGSIIVIWNEVAGAKGYNVYQDSSTRPLNGSTLWTKTTCRITQLALGWNYSFRITAVDENGVESDYSKAESILAQETHNWNEKIWQKDKTSHWYGCKNCDEKKDEAVHTMSNWTIDGAYHSRYCTVCGYVESELHKPDATWSFSEGRHWHVCTVEGCGAEVDGESHVYSDDTDAVCNTCGYTRKIVPQNVKYNILSGSGSRYMKKSDSDVKVSCDGAFEKFTGITVDGVTVDSRNYTVASGSTILTLKSSYLDTLKVGSHELVFQYTDGSASTKVLITEHVHSYTPWTDNGNGQTHSRSCACGEEEVKYHRWDNGKVTVRPTETTKGIRTYTCKDCGAKLYKELAPGTNAYTGDQFQMGLWITILIVSAGAIAAIVVVSRIKSKGKGKKGGKFSQSRR